MTIKKNVIKTVNRQPTSAYEDILDANGNILVVQCRVTQNNLGIKMFLFVLKNQYDLIPGGLHQNYQITVQGLVHPYIIKTEPFWSAGVQHHIEALLEEMT
jgi:hypothetical protein